MQSRQIYDSPETYVLIFDKGDEVLKELERFANETNLSASHFTGIGALSDLVLGYFSREKRDYRKIPLREQVEVLSLMGDISLSGDEVKVHAHVVVGRADGTAHGGHLLEAHVWPTLELIVTESPVHLRRKHDPDTGLALIDLDSSKTSVSGR